eukprot:2467849-Prymnesium_polylepis.1
MYERFGVCSRATCAVRVCREGWPATWRATHVALRHEELQQAPRRRHASLAPCGARAVTVDLRDEALGVRKGLEGLRRLLLVLQTHAV